ncbi:hypothetical protein FRB99_000937, partial [Tulasnella sp. 403]
MFSSLALATLLAVSTVNAAVWNISVGANGLTFSPNTATPAVGDTLHFQFAANHSATQSTFTAPCAPMSGGFNSGFLFTSAANNPTFDVQVNSTDPIWVYCAQPGHCQAGMVFAANPTAAQTFNAFQATAEGKSSPAASSTPAAMNEFSLAKKAKGKTKAKGSTKSKVATQTLNPKIPLTLITGQHCVHGSQTTHQAMKENKEEFGFELAELQKEKAQCDSDLKEYQSLDAALKCLGKENKCLDCKMKAVWFWECMIYDD